MKAEELLGDGTMGIVDAQKFTGLGRTILYDLMSRGELPFTKVGTRRLIPRKALVRILTHNLAGRLDES